MTRLTLLDGLRGYFLVNMYIRHTLASPNDPLDLLTISHFGFAQSPHGFIFLSGLLVGLIYFTPLISKEDSRANYKLLNRSREIYTTSMITVLFLLTIAFTLPVLGQHWGGRLGPLLELSPPAFAATAILLYQPAGLDVLPQYVIYMLVAPLFFFGVRRYGLVIPMVVSITLWALVQFGAHRFAAEAINDHLFDLHPDLMIRTGFNIFSWQLLFFFGVTCGVAHRRYNHLLSQLFSEKNLARPLIAFVVVIAALVLRRHFSDTYALREMPELLVTLTSKANLGLIPIIDFLAKGYLLTWLIVAAPQASFRLFRSISQLVTFIGNLSYFRLLGRHSLQVFAWHVPVTYLVTSMYQVYPNLDTIERSLIVICGMITLMIPSLVRESAIYVRFRRRSAARA